MHGHRDDARTGIRFMVTSMAVLTASDAGAKWLAPNYSAVEIMLLRSLLCVGPAWWWCRRRRMPLGTRALGGHLARTLLMLVAWGLFIHALRVLPLADAFAIAFASPVFITVLGFLILGERVTAGRWLAVLVGFAGVLTILQPGAIGLHSASLAALGATVAWSFSTLLSRRLTRTESSETMVLYYMVISVIVLGALQFVAPWRTPQWVDSPAFAVNAAAGLVGHWLMNEAFRRAPVSVLAPFEYIGLLCAVGYGYLLFGDVPGSMVVVGSALIVGSGIYVSRTT